MALVRVLVCSLAILLSTVTLSAQQLEIHYIDVGWGGSVFIKGPSGTTVLLEGGDTGEGTAHVVPYLKSIGVQPANGLDYVIGGHQHCDHIGGLDEVINAGYNVHIKQYNNGSTYASSCADGWNTASASTTAGAPVAMPVGTVIQLGNGAKLTCVARNGSIIGGGSVAVSDENDRSIALLIQYGGFDYLWASDLGGGADACAGHTTSQSDIESSVIRAISPGGASPLITAGGIDLLHVNHHGSESSTNPTYFNLAKPAVAIIGVGSGETTGWDLPRVNVVDNVLLGAASSCVTAPPAFVLQTEEGSPAGTKTSHSGYCVGNIKVTTDGLNLFTVSADGLVHQGPNEVAAAGLPRSFTLDSAGTPPADTTAPTTSISAPAAGATVSGTTTVTASATDNVAVTKVEFYLDGALTATDTTSPYSWSWTTTSATNGAHSLTSKAYDAAGNVGTSAARSVTVSNTTTPPPQQLLGNPGFETGTASPWTATAGIIDNTTSEAAHSGTWKAWLDGYGSAHTDSLLQTVTIPSTATTATLSFWLHIDTAETSTTAYDTLKVQIRNTSGTVLATLATYSNANAATGFAQKSFNVLTYKGQTLQVYVVGVEDATLQTSFVVDDFALNVQ
jgi:beta-lactamase superfamily II metal-dependent hydrolase